MPPTNFEPMRAAQMMADFHHIELPIHTIWI